MAMQLDTETPGNNVEGNTQSTQQMKECIYNEFNNKSIAEKIYLTLIDQEITDLDILIFSDDNDLINLCNKLNLPLGVTMKFKALVRKLKNQNQLSTPRQNTIAITNKEQIQINKIESALKKSQNILQLLTTHQNEIQQHCTAAKSNINKQIIALIESLHKRQQILNNEMDKWESNKKNNIQSEISNITKYQIELKSIINKFDNLFTNNKYIIEQREQRIQHITQQFIDNNTSYKTFKDIKLLQKYIDNNTKLSHIQFDGKISIDKLDKFGIINSNISNNKFQIPALLLTDVMKSKDVNKGYKIKLQWDFKVPVSTVTEEKYSNSDFVVKYIECDDNEENDMKESLQQIWNVLRNVNIQFISKHNDLRFYIADINKLFEYKKLYQFKIEKYIQKPIELIIKSNIQPFSYDKKSNIVNIDMNKQTEIGLKIHSYKGCYGPEYKAENILKLDNSYYCSSKGVIKNDWIIFDICDENLYYYPIMVKLRAWDGNGSVQQFNFYIGNVEKNEWIKCNEREFISDRSFGKDWQMFNLDIVKSNNVNDNINRKWKEIELHRYHCLKLELLNNYGNSNYVGLYGLKVFGVGPYFIRELKKN